MKKVLITFLVFAFTGTQAQITVTVGSALLQTQGTDVHLPVSVKGLNGQAGGKGVTGLEFHIGYVNSRLVYDTTLNFSAITPSSQWVYGANGIEYSTNWIEPAGNKLNIPDNTILFEIVLHYLGGTADLAFDTARCLLIDSAYNIMLMEWLLLRQGQVNQDGMEQDHGTALPTGAVVFPAIAPTRSLKPGKSQYFLRQFANPS
jgi:hypothetical protein